MMAAEVLSEVRKAATQAGLMLMMHANSFEAQKFAVDGDVDVFAHGMWNWGDFDRQRKCPIRDQERARSHCGQKDWLSADDSGHWGPACVFRSRISEDGGDPKGHSCGDAGVVQLSPREMVQERGLCR